MGDYLYQHQRLVIQFSVTELADATGTSEASVIRFSQKLGYPGFSALKIALALELQDATPAVLGDLDESDDLVTIKRKVIEGSIGGLRDTLDLLDDAALSHAVDAIEQAPRIGPNWRSLLAAAEKTSSGAIKVLVHPCMA